MTHIIFVIEFACNTVIYGVNSMSLFVWKESFSVGVGDIDRQHEEFISHINNCSRVYSGCDDPDVTLNMVRRLKEYVTEHFTFEEELLRANSYPDFARHLEQHSYFEHQVKELELTISGGRFEKVESIVVFMRDWFLNHILEEDRNYLPYLDIDSEPGKNPSKPDVVS